MSLGLIYKNAAHIFDEVEKKTPYLEYPLFQETGIVTSAFSTRLGGVSEGYYSSLNLSFDRGDDPARVLENFKRIGASMGVAVEDMVLSKQTHTTNVRVVTKEDKGKGVMRERNYTDVDGMITNVPGICLVTSYADCATLLCGSGEKGNRAESLRLERNCWKDWKKYCSADAGEFWIQTGRSACSSRTIGMYGLL